MWGEMALKYRITSWHGNRLRQMKTEKKGNVLERWKYTLNNSQNGAELQVSVNKYVCFFRNFNITLKDNFVSIVP